MVEKFSPFGFQSSEKYGKIIRIWVFQHKICTAVVKSFLEFVEAVQPKFGSPNEGSPAVMNTDTFNSVVMDVVDEEDWSRNVGISKDKGQSLEEKISLACAGIE